jgi:zinc protease
VVRIGHSTCLSSIVPILRPRCEGATPRLALVILAATMLVAAPAVAQRATLERITRHDTLPNGLAVIVVENHSVPLATVEVVVRAGAMIQEPEDQGVPHLYEHMLFRGYQGPQNQSFRRIAGELKAAFNGTTSDETVSYYMILPSVNVRGAVDALADLVRRPRFVKDELNRERFIVLGEFQRRASEPSFSLSRAVNELLWGEGFVRKNAIGDQTAVLTVTPEHLDEIFHRYYVPNNAALIVTGDVSAPAVFEMARHAFEGWARRDDPFAAHPVAPMPPLAASRAVVVTGDVSDVTIEIAWHGPSVRKQAEATYAADVLSDLLADDRSGFRHRLVDSGLFQSLSLGYNTLANTGPIELHGVTTLKYLPGALTALQNELRMMTDTAYFSAADLEIAKKRRAVATVLRLEQGLGLAQTVGDLWSVAGLDYHFGYVDNLSARSLVDVRRFISDHLADKPFVIGALTSEKDAEEVSRTLAQYLTFVNEK